MKNDLEIAREAKVKPIEEIAASIGIEKDDFLPLSYFFCRASTGTFATYFP